MNKKHAAAPTVRQESLTPVSAKLLSPHLKPTAKDFEDVAAEFRVEGNHEAAKRAETKAAELRKREARRVVVEIDGEMAELVGNLADWMQWPADKVGAALIAAMLESFCGDDMETVQACFNSHRRYCATGRVHEAWRTWLGKEAG